MITLCVLAMMCSAGSALAQKEGEAASVARKKAPAPVVAGDLPEIKSKAAIVFDMDNGAVYHTKNADTVRHIASTGKIFIAMLARRKGINLAKKTAITTVDRYWARGGSRTRLDVHHSVTNHNLLRAMLISSDNRAPTALGRAVGLKPEEQIKSLNKLAKDMRLTNTKFTDVPGIRGNISTARDMARAYRAAMSDAVLRDVMATAEATVRTHHSKPVAILYRNSNLPMHSGRYKVTGGKTGFNTPAGYCLLTSAKLGNKHVGMIFLGADSKLTRFADFYRVAAWFTSGATAPIEANIGKAVGGVGSI